LIAQVALESPVGVDSPAEEEVVRVAERGRRKRR
jgi:hypothetical protein